MIIWVVLGLIIIASLVGYLAYLLYQIRSQKQVRDEQRTQAILARQNKIAESVEVIAKATAQGQCDYSEAAIRITQLLMAYPESQPRDWPALYPGLFGLYKTIGHLPTHQDRMALSKAKRREQDDWRLSQEQLFADLINEELHQLSRFAAKGAQ
jgi:hypothetical protein